MVKLAVIIAAQLTVLVTVLAGFAFGQWGTTTAPVTVPDPAANAETAPAATPTAADATAAPTTAAPTTRPPYPAAAQGSYANPDDRQGPPPAAVVLLLLSVFFAAVIIYVAVRW